MRCRLLGRAGCQPAGARRQCRQRWQDVKENIVVVFKEGIREARRNKPVKLKKAAEREPSGETESETSSDSDDDSSSAGSRSASSSSSAASRHASPEKKTKSTKKRTKYNRKHQLKGKAVKNANMLIVCLVRLLRRCYNKGKDVGDLINHLLVMAEKTETGMYQLDCLLGYDDECREHANERGIKSFAEIKPATVLRFLSYDSTTAARKQSQNSQSSQAQSKKSGQRGFCYDFNTQVGCDNGACNFRHTCMFCGSSPMEAPTAKEVRWPVENLPRTIEKPNSTTLLK